MSTSGSAAARRTPRSPFPGVSARTDSMSRVRNANWFLGGFRDSSSAVTSVPGERTKRWSKRLPVPVPSSWWP